MAQLKNTSIDSTSDLSLPSGTTAQRPATPLQGMIRYNTTLNTTEYYDGIAWRSISDTGVEATGGTIIDTEIGGVAYRIHQFTATGNSTFTVTKGGEVEYLIVAGGGAGASGDDNSGGGGGGGAGGLLTGITTVTPQLYTITVGVGGNPTGTEFTGLSQSQNGSNSAAFGLTAIGGGGAGGAASTPQSGGSGGGSFRNQTAGLGISGQGNAGGNTNHSGTGGGGGGGGAGSAGGQATTVQGGAGGQGIASSITGLNVFYAAGGAGAGQDARSGIPPGIPAAGGASGGFNSRGSSAVPTSGSGGGGGSTDQIDRSGSGFFGGSGGSGIVVVRYRRNAGTTTSPTRTLISTVPNNFSIVQDGLVLHLDAGLPVSYPGTGTVWQDLSQFGLNASAVGGTPSYSNVNGGVTIVSGNNWSVPDNQALKLTGTRTLIAWFKMSALTGGAGIAGKANSSVNGLALGYGWSNGGFMALAWNSSNSPALSRDLQRDINQWNYLVALIDSSSNRVIYAFDALGVRTASSDAASQSWNNTLPFGIGAANGNGDSRVPGGSQFGSVFVYNRALSFAELEQNFNSTRGRYGI